MAAHSYRICTMHNNNNEKLFTRLKVENMKVYSAYLVQKRKENKLNISMLTIFSRKRLIYNLILFVLHIRIGHNSVKCQQTNHFNIIVILNIKDGDLRQRIRSYVFFYYPQLIPLSGNFVHNIFLSRSLTVKRSKVRNCRKGLS